jgi:hypothetical protein
VTASPTRQLCGVLAVGALVACGGDGTDCADVLCGACPAPMTLEIQVPGGGGPPTVMGAALTCNTDGILTTCVGSSAGPGDYQLSVRAEGYEDQILAFTLEPGGSGCCACSVLEPFSRRITLQRTALDAGAGDAAGDGG